ncbi:unnamed protein product, partial [Pylaiella littoralis]
MYGRSSLCLPKKFGLKWRPQKAKIALSKGEVPVGCVIVHGPTKRIVSCGHNKTNEAFNATRHAELVAIDSILQANADLSILRECDMVVTCEPCIMCAAALRDLEIKTVVFGCSNDRFGGCGSVLSVHNGSLPMTGHTYPCQSGLLADEAVALFKQFYSRQNVKDAPISTVLVVVYGGHLPGAFQGRHERFS